MPDATPPPAAALPDRIPVVAPDGTLSDVPAEELAKAFRHGYTQPSAEQLHQLDLQDSVQGAGQGAKAFGEGAASALTGGLSAGIERAAGVDPEMIRARAEHRSILHGLGTATGIAVPLALTAGASAPLEGAALAGEGVSAAADAGLATRAASFTAPALISRAGQGAAALAESAGLPGAIGKLAPVVAGGVAEGGLYSGSDVVEKALLKDPQLTWEGAASEIGLGALLGGGLAGGTDLAAKGLGKIISKASEGLGGIAEKLASSNPENNQAVVKLMFEGKNEIADLSKVIPNAAEQIRASTPETAKLLIKHAAKIGELSEVVPDAMEYVRRALPDSAEFMINNSSKIADIESRAPGLMNILSQASDGETFSTLLKGWEDRMSDPMVRRRVGEGLVDSVNSTYSAVEDAKRELGSRIRPEETNRLLHIDGNNAAVDASNGTAGPGKHIAEAQRVGARINDTIEEMRSRPELYPAMYPAKLEAIRDGLARETASGVPADIFSSINETKQLLEPLAKFGKIAGPEHQDAIASVKKLRGMIKDSLEDTKVWGEAGQRQADYNRAFTQHANATDQITKGPAFQKLMQKITLPNGAVRYEANPRSVSAWVNAMASEGGSAKTDTWARYLTTAKAYADQAEKSGYEGADVLRAKISHAVDIAKQTRERGLTTNVVESFQRKPIRGGIATPDFEPPSHVRALEMARHLPGAAGHIAHLTGRIVGGIGKVRNPAATVGVLSALDKLAKKASAKLSRGVSGIFRTGEGVAGAHVAEKFSTGGIVTPEGFAGHAAHIRNLGGDLDRFASQVSGETSGVQDHAPATAAAAHAFAARAVSLLGSKLPDAGPRKPLDPPFKPTRTELADYNRHHEIANHGPAAVLDHMSKGTLHQDHVAASEQLFPKMHAEMQQQLFDKVNAMHSKGEPIPRHLRSSLGMVLGDLDSTVTGDSILAAQATFAAPDPGRGAPPPKPGSKPRNVQTHLSENAATGSQGTQMRMGKS